MNIKYYIVQLRIFHFIFIIVFMCIYFIILSKFTLKSSSYFVDKWISLQCYP